VFKSLLFANVFVELMYKILKMSDAKLSDAEFNALLDEYANADDIEVSKPKQLTEKELAAQLAALQAEFDAEHQTTPRTPSMSDEDFEAALAEYAEYSGGKTRRHKKRTYKKKKSMYKKKRTYKKKHASKKKHATRRRKH
jgi:hypothetical protein